MTKTADATSVSAGLPIGFKVQIKNAGDGIATGITFSDALPSGTGISWSIVGTPADWSITGSVPNQVLNYIPTTLAGHTNSSEVHVVSSTTKDSCKAYPNSATVGSANDGGNIASATTTVLCPNIHAVKTVGDGQHLTTANPGDVLHYSITVTNSGDAAGTAAVTDNVNAILAHATISPISISDSGTLTAGVITWPTFTLAANGGTKTLTFDATLFTSFPDGTTHLPNAVVVIGTGSNCTPTSEQNADCKTDTGVGHYLLTIDKTNDARIVTLVLPGGSTANIPTADEGSTVTYTLTYAVGKLSVTNAVIKDVLPAGIQYVNGSATNNDEFTFQGYDSLTRTLSWTAAHVTKNGSLSYKALVLTGANALSQPLTNTATIDSDQTGPASDTSKIFVPVIPKGETAPPTDVLVAPVGTNGPGSSLMLILAVFGLLVVSIGLITPVPAAVRRRNHR